MMTRTPWPRHSMPTVLLPLLLLTVLLLPLFLLLGCGGEGTPATETPSSELEPTATAAPASPTPARAPTLSELLLAADNGSNQLKILDPKNEEVVASVNLGQLNPGACAGEEDCFIFGGTHALLEGHDTLTMTYGLQTTFGLNTGFEGYVDRVQLGSPPTLRWRLHALDFSKLPGGASAYCPASTSDPCQARSDVPIEEQGLCWVSDAHDVEVLSDDPVNQEAVMVVADTDSVRMLRVKLRYGEGNTCGEVLSVLDGDRHADWPPGAEPNNLVRVPESSGRELYLVTIRALTHTTATDGDGVLQLWEYTAEGWNLHWTFPEQVEGQERAFSLPHGGELLLNAHPEGHLFRFAHSASLATDRDYKVNDSEGGSLSFLLLRDLFSPPDYLFDLYFPFGDAEQDVLRFARFAERQPDGTMLVTDSGCQADVRCDYRARLYWMRDDWTGNSSLEGYWTPSQSQLELTEGQEGILHTLQCGLVSPFWVVRIPSETLGIELQAAREAGGAPCIELLKTTP